MDGQGTQEETAQSSPSPSVFDRITKFIKTVVVSLVLVGVVVVGGMLGWAYITDDHTLRGEVSYQYLDDGQGYYLIVTNQDSSSWSTPTVIVNGKYKFKSQDLSRGKTYNFDLTQFSSDSGERFLPDQMVPTKVKIESSWDSTEWTFR